MISIWKKQKQSRVICAVEKKSAQVWSQKHPTDGGDLKPEAATEDFSLVKLFLTLHRPQVSDRLGSIFAMKQGTFKKSVVNRTS